MCSAQLFELCVDKASFALFTPENGVDFSTAITSCEEKGMTLARISTAQEQNVLMAKVIDSQLNNSVHIGVHRLDQQDSVTEPSTSQFVYVDETTGNEEFYSIPREFPWNDRNPNNLQGSAFCVS